MNQEISRRISFLGFVMTCGIVLYHCGPSPAVPSVGLDQVCFDAISNFFTNTATLAMSYFFAVTGYLLFLNLSLRGWAGKVKRRTFSLLVPYLAWQCLTFAVNLLHHEAMTKREFLKTTFLLDQWPPDGALWYLYAVFLLALLAPVILLIYERAGRCRGFCLTFAAILFFYWLQSADFASAFCQYGYVNNILRYMPSYLLGAYFGFYCTQASEIDNLRFLLAALLAALAADAVFSSFFSLMTLQVLPLFALFLLPTPEFLCDRKVYHLSFLVYALHQPLLKHLLHPIRDLMYVVYPASPAALINGLGRVLYLLAILCLARALHTMLSRFCPKALDVLTGGRK